MISAAFMALGKSYETTKVELDRSRNIFKERRILKGRSFLIRENKIVLRSYLDCCQAKQSVYVNTDMVTAIPNKEKQERKEG